MAYFIDGPTIANAAWYPPKRTRKDNQGRARAKGASAWECTSKDEE